MPGLLFVSHAILDTWVGQGKIEFSGNVMAILSGAGQGRSYVLEPALRFLAVEGADADPHGLLHKVKPEAWLRAQGAELMGDAAILGDVAYRVEPGFLAEAAALQAAAGSRAPAPRAAPPPAPPPAAGPQAVPADPRRKEAEELARFLLENLS